MEYRDRHDRHDRHDNRGGRRYGGRQHHNNRDRHQPYNKSSNYRDKRKNYRRNDRDEADNIVQRLRGLIIKIGDKITPDLETNLVKMRNILDLDYEKYPEMVQSTLKACVAELPVKAPIYAALIGLLNVKNHALTAKLMDVFHSAWAHYVQQHDWCRIKNMVRFYGELVNNNVIAPSAYGTFLDAFLDPISNVTTRTPQHDALVYTVLVTLPWCGKEMQERGTSSLDATMNKIEKYMNGNATSDLPIVRVFPHVPAQDLVQHAWQLLQNAETKEWQSDVIVRVYPWFSDDFQTAMQHKLPVVDVATLITSSTATLPGVPTLKIFVNDDDTTVSSLPDHASLEYMLVHDMASDTALLFESNRKDAAKYLLNIATGCPDHCFAKPDAEDQDRETDDQGKWNFSELLMEALFSQMLHLPSPTCVTVYYPTLMAELVRLEKTTFPKALGRSIKALFDRLPGMDVACIERLWSWFAVHLSNFGFTWDWAAWEPALDNDPMHPQVCFMRETIEREIRLSYYDRVKANLPERVARDACPPQAPAPVFAYSDKTHELHAAAITVIQALKEKQTPEQIQQALDAIKQDLAAKGYDEEKQQSALQDLFIQCLLLVGCKSFSHVLNVIERYLDILRQINQKGSDKVRTVEIVASFWKDNSQFLAILLDKFLNYRIVEPTSVVAWVFESALMDNASRGYIWDILKNTVSKVINRVAQVQARLDQYQEMHTDNEKRRSEQELTDVARAEAQQELETLNLVETSLTTVKEERQQVMVLMYQKFTQALQTLLSALSAQGKNPEQDWTFWWVHGWFKEMLRLYHAECQAFQQELASVVFTEQLDPQILDLYKQWQALP
ncbi:armadillo-type protein [Gongronella butleri]|nr:armadillo-type protein [Gongronella butleri]